MAYIDREKFAEAICNCPAIDESAANAVISLLHRQTTADVEEVRHGEWIKNQYISQVLKIPVKKEFVFTCSLCGHDTLGKSKYCRECGAKMDGDKAE